MRTLWQAEKNQLVWDWSDLTDGEGHGTGELMEGKPAWLAEAEAMAGGYLPPLTDFSSHSPFGGATWFYPDPGQALRRFPQDRSANDRP